MCFVKNGRMTIPLYHGTSSMFLPSIEKHGLGGKNPLAELHALDWFRRLLTLCDSALGNDEEWRSERFVAVSFAEQEVTAGGFNFRHGDTYLTPSRQSAVNYALKNRWGSEFLSLGFLLYEKLLQRCPEVLETAEVRGSPVMDLCSGEAHPILVQAHDVPLAQLRSESGSRPEREIEGFESLSGALEDLKERLRSGGVFNFNFLLTEAVSSEHFTVAWLDSEKETIVSL